MPCGSHIPWKLPRNSAGPGMSAEHPALAAGRQDTVLQSCRVRPRNLCKTGITVAPSLFSDLLTKTRVSRTSTPSQARIHNMAHMTACWLILEVVSGMRKLFSNDWVKEFLYKILFLEIPFFHSLICTHYFLSTKGRITNYGTLILGGYHNQISMNKTVRSFTKPSLRKHSVHYLPWVYFLRTDSSFPLSPCNRYRASACDTSGVDLLCLHRFF